MSKLLLATLALSCLSACSMSPVANQKDHLITALVERGSDVNKIHQIRYHISCQSKKEVEQVAKLATEKGFTTETVTYFKTDDNWYVALGKSSLLKTKPIYASIELLTQLQDTFVCEEVTWGTKVVS